MKLLFESDFDDDLQWTIQNASPTVITEIEPEAIPSGLLDQFGNEISRRNPNRRPVGFVWKT